MFLVYMTVVLCDLKKLLTQIFVHVLCVFFSERGQVGAEAGQQCNLTSKGGGGKI